MKVKVLKGIDKLACGMIVAEHKYDELGILVCREGDEVTEAVLIDLRDSGIDKIAVLEDSTSDEAECNTGSHSDEDMIKKTEERDARVDRSLSLIMHHEEVREIAGVIKKVIRKESAK